VGNSVGKFRYTLGTCHATPTPSAPSYQAAVRFGKQSELHAVLAGKALLVLRRNMGAREWREWVTNAHIPGTAIAKYIRAAEALEITACLEGWLEWIRTVSERVDHFHRKTSGVTLRR
jgi:hypothetical protein